MSKSRMLVKQMFFVIALCAFMGVQSGAAQTTPNHWRDGGLAADTGYEKEYNFLNLVSAGGLNGANATNAGAKVSPPAQDGLWADVAESAIPIQGERRVFPRHYRTLRLNLDWLKVRLQKAPLEFTQAAKTGAVEITIPLPGGNFGRFRIVDSPIMEPLLAAQYPDIRNFSGQGIDDPTASMRFDLTPDGFHAFVLASEGTFLVAPYARNDTSNYISYLLKDDPSEGNFKCFSKGTEAKLPRNTREAPQVDNGATLRTYRLAVAATGEYTAQNGGTVASALSAINTRMVGVNAIFVAEMSIRLTLIANQNNIIYLDGSNDPYTSQNVDSLIVENQVIMDFVIGSANYDIGQVFDAGIINGGSISSSGLATRLTTCNNASKGRGTSGGNNVLLAAHEMAHQLGATHTFNDNANGNCGANGADQRQPDSAYEPGSGSTIMSYAGTCATANLQLATDSYFHIKSLEQMVAYTTGDGFGGTCDVETPTNRGGIVVQQYSPEITVPALTPFKLSFTAVDVSSIDPRPLRFTWEEYDLGAASPPEIDNGNRPIFRSYRPALRNSADPPNTGTRPFPALGYILFNNSIPPPTYNCGTAEVPVACLTGEARVTTARDMTFQGTARDNLGAIHSVPVQVHVVNTGSPFGITNLNEPNITWAMGTRQEIIWNPANTASAPINVANVKITLTNRSNGLGFSQDIVLAASVPNNGHAFILVPELVSLQRENRRVRVESIIDGNVNSFFDISNTDITLQPISVTNTNDMGEGSLRQAINEANFDPGLTNIQFNIPGAGVHTINLLQTLPVISAPVVLDGWSQGGADYSGPPLIEINGAGAGAAANGLTISGGNSTINGLAINRFAMNGIEFLVNGGNVIEGCYIGANAAGTATLGNGGSGVLINNTPNNRLGTATSLGQFQRNIIAGNNVGVTISGAAAAGNELYYNLIGTNINGARLSNTLDGIRIIGAPNNLIGGTRSSGGVNFPAGNIISGNGVFSSGASGIEISGATASGNRIAANFIGLAPNGTTALLNNGGGIYIDNAPNTVIGGVTGSTGNYISGNENTGGIYLANSGASGTTIQGNFLGTNLAGNAAVTNNAYNIYVASANNQIGGTTPGARNIISGFQNRGGTGIHFNFSGATNNVVQGNYIGTDATGTQALCSSGTGINNFGGSNNTIGGTTPAARNIISGNVEGIRVDSSSTNINIQGNYIGTNPAGDAAVPNTLGISVLGSSNITIGGTVSGAGNVISGNGNAGGGYGIRLFVATGSVVQGNRIGTNAAGNAALGNSFGVQISDGSSNVIGGATPAARNLISASRFSGIFLNTTGATIQGNYIGTDINGTANLGNGLPNGSAGIETAGTGNTIGGSNPGEGNIIAFSGSGNPQLPSGPGVRVGGANQRVRGNSIFGNTELGIDLVGGEVSTRVTPNDSCDADTGSNNRQNFPVLTSVSSASGATNIIGALNSTANTAFTLDFYTNPTCDSSGHGEGTTWLGAATATTDGACNASFTAAFPVALPEGQFITATATDPLGNTSEFSACSETVGIESDIAPRPNGNNALAAVDIIQIRRFVAGLDVVAVGHEFQRADSAPSTTFGNGLITATDVTQTRRYVAGLNAPTSVKGPSSPSDNPATSALPDAPTRGRAIRVGSQFAIPGKQVVVPLEIDAQGDEVALSFSLNYDPTVLSVNNDSARITLGNGVPVGAALTSNANTPGQIGIVLDSATPFAAGKRRLVTITFDVIADLTATKVSLGDAPAMRDVSDIQALSLPANYQSGLVSLAAPTREIRKTSDGYLSEDSRHNKWQMPFADNNFGFLLLSYKPAGSERDYATW